MGKSFSHESLQLTVANRIGRTLWSLVWLLLYRTSPRPMHFWRRWLLRLFGARIGAGARSYSRVRIWAPWNLTMGAYSCLANDVDCYCVAPVTLGAYAVVSQYAYLCAATHDIRDPSFPLVVAPIVIEDEAWVAAGAFVGPGVRIGEGAVVGARSVVMEDVPAWTVMASGELREIGKRPPQARRGIAQ